MMGSVQELEHPNKHLIESLDYKVLYQNGCFRRVIYFFDGWHPEYHKEHDQIFFTYGWRGRETHIIRNEILPIYTFEIIDSDADNGP